MLPSNWRSLWTTTGCLFNLHPLTSFKRIRNHQILRGVFVHCVWWFRSVSHPQFHLFYKLYTLPVIPNVKIVLGGLFTPPEVNSTLLGDVFVKHLQTSSPTGIYKWRMAWKIWSDIQGRLRVWVFDWYTFRPPEGLVWLDHYNSIPIKHWTSKGIRLGCLGVNEDVSFCFTMQLPFRTSRTDNAGHVCWPPKRMTWGPKGIPWLISYPIIK